MSRIKVLSTKVLDKEVRSAAFAAGLDVEEVEMIAITHLTGEEKTKEIIEALEKGSSNLVFTSANAVIPFRTYLKQASVSPDWKLFCLSGRTLEELEELKIGTIAAVADHAGALADMILEKGVQDLLFFCGNQRRDELPQKLKAAGLAVNEVIVYQTEETPVALQAEYKAVLFFSPSGVSSFFALNQLTPDAVCCSIGQTTAAAIREFTTTPVIVAPAPTQQAMINALLAYFNINRRADINNKQ